MAGGFTVTLTTQNLATPVLLRLPGVIQRSDIRKVMGRAIATTMRKNFTKLDAQRPNKLGGARTHFYAQARRGVQQPELVAGDGVKVAVNHVGIRQRLEGGRIERADGGPLTIPVHPAAHGHRAREFDLHAIYFQDGSGILVKDNTESKNDIGEVYFRLVKSVDQKPDPSVLPKDEVMQAAALDAGDAHAKTIIEREGLSNL